MSGLLQTVSNTIGLKVGRINIRSLLLRIEEIRHILVGQPIDILSVNETFLADSILGLEISIPGYTVHRNDRGSRHGGGVALYVRSDLSHEPCPDVNTNTVAEVCWIKVTLPHTKPVIIGTIYRPPSHNQDYFNALLDTTEEATAQGNDVVILGDLNYNYVPGDPRNPVHLMEQLFSMTQIIKEPARVTTTSSTTLDVVLTTMPDKHIKTGVISCGLSDHHLVYTVIGSKVPDQPPRTVTCRDYKNFNVAGFLHNLGASLDKLPDTEDCNIYWNALKKTIETVSNCRTVQNSPR